jgi:ribosomal protein S14
MLQKKITDSNTRQKFLILERKKIIYKLVMINYLNIIKKQNYKNVKLNSKLSLAICNINKKILNISKSKIKNKCILTFRKRSINNKYAISRLKMLELLKFGIIPGYHKAVW